jgi:hypothetical protein
VGLFPKDMIVVDRHAFDQLWPALAVWLACFLTAGDGIHVLKRQYALLTGKRAVAELKAESRERVPFLRAQKRDYFHLRVGLDDTGKQPVGRGGLKKYMPGAQLAVHVRGGTAYLDDDFGYSRFKLGLFGAVFLALWAWAAARYRFG